jgi:VanZ like protein/concanavalin A-like lectin/glucanase superfamily protein
MSRIQRLLGGVCFLLLLGLLGFGLWPFNFFEKNRVTWLPDRNGIHFDGYGQIYNTVSGNMPGEIAPDGKGSVTVELWVRPWQKKYPHFSSIFFVDHPDKSKNFAIIQSGPDLLVQAPFVDRDSHTSFRRIWIDDACAKGEPRFVTLTSGADGSNLYLEGVFQKHSPFTLTSDSLFGRLLLGHPPLGHQPWTGDILGVAIYGKTLNANDVSQHYKAWQDHNTADLSKHSEVAALYIFDERSGSVVHSRAGSAPDLFIPKSFSPLHPTILSYEFEFDRAELADVLINIFGFAPFGFFLCAYLRSGKTLTGTKAILWAILLGGVTSLAIELLQVYLPSRDSSLLDVIDNILGTALGAFLFTWIAKKIGPRSKIA